MSYSASAQFYYSHNIFSQPEADFVGTEITVTLPSGDFPSQQVDVEVPIIDDAIVEAQQTFVGFIQIQGAIDEGTIMLERTAAMLIINDNDGKTINSCKK